MSERQQDENRGVAVISTQNDRGEWVPAIPEPTFTFGLFGSRYRCECGETRSSKQSYREHYALAHILALS